MSFDKIHFPIDIRKIGPGTIDNIEVHTIVPKKTVTSHTDITFGNDDGIYDTEILSSIFTKSYQTHEVIISIVKECLIGPRPEGLPRYWPILFNNHYLWNYINSAAKDALEEQGEITVKDDCITPINHTDRIKIGGKSVWLYIFSNIDHLYRESLPAIIALKEIYGSLSQFTFIIPHCPENILSILETMGIKREKIVQTGNTWIECEHVLILSFLSFGHLHTPSHYYIKACDDILSNLTTPLTVKPTKKIFVSRKNAQLRRLINESELYEDLIDMGFTICDPGDYSPEEQASLFSTAELVVGSHGMGIANCAFSKNLKLLVEIMPTSWNRVSYYRLAQLRDVKYACYWITPQNNELTINKDKFITFLRNILEESKCS